MAADRRRHIEFEVDAWLTDEAIAGISLAAEGLWFRCLLLMFKNDKRRGYLECQGKSLHAADLAKILRRPRRTVEKLLDELESAGVLSREPGSNTIFNRRMVRDEKRRQQAIANGRKGGNPHLRSAPARHVVPSHAIEQPTHSTPPAEQHMHEEPDWLVIEAEFLRQWNGLKGVIRQSGNAMPHNLVRDFHNAWRTPGWWERADEAMRKFPLKNGVTMGLRTFLRPTTIDEIIGGLHDFDASRGGRRKNTKGSAMSALERELGARMDEVDQSQGVQ